MEYLYIRFTMEGKNYPNPLDEEEWLTCVLLRAMTTNKAINYTQQHDMVKDIMRCMEIITRKRTHVFRVGGTQALDAAGASRETAQRMGHWQEGSALVESYLMPVPYDGLLMLAGFDCCTPDKLKTAYWAQHFMLEISPALLEPLKVAIFSSCPSYAIARMKPPVALDCLISIQQQMAMLPVQQTVILQHFLVQQQRAVQLAQASQDLGGLMGGAAGGSGVGGLAQAGAPGLTPGRQQQRLDFGGLMGGAAGGSGVGGLAQAGAPGLTPGRQQQRLDLGGLMGGAAGGSSAGGLAQAGAPGLTPGRQQQLMNLGGLMGGGQLAAAALAAWRRPAHLASRLAGSSSS
ncbi:hypothetical protein VOLCADRAFT_91646 [Volvox carteri f. nagariensis]|uniref:Uncharacterized protein n=1 Tax=Volvox carteri f. nagariensis TaxID=3068 RepID=D8TXM3_VOLCA|nr:uncharacterized protein VOLCADRAFT_91646 [Volvox carteri f. nagariensis]EFJ47750.1 hypothetical protein VOLCADRAFT_91646 [Volvox carteri f. nagariensis]|eukprot:XP_002951221.1 hypothetical protein VOLCADRAFT_91646 [Volvox carteri f. nagariensis]